MPRVGLDHGISDFECAFEHVVGHFEWTLVDIHWWTLGGGHDGHDGHLVDMMDTWWTLGGHSLVDKSELLVRHLVDT